MKLFLMNRKIKILLNYMLKIYIGWSVCADCIIIGGIVYLIFF